MRTWRMFLAVLLGATVLRWATANEAARPPQDDPRTDAAIRELVRRGVVVKRFAVVESETEGLLVRLKTKHVDRAGKIDLAILSALQPLKELTLELRNVPLTDEGLKSLLTSVRLTGLDVSGAEISDRGLLELASQRSRLRLLDLSFTQVSDEGLKSVAALSELRHLSLIGCQITDRSVNAMARLSQLREVYLAKTAVSDQATEQLRRTLPKCRIERSPQRD